MKYGNVNLKIKFESLSFVTAKSQDIRHYPGTDISDAINKGKKPTKISCKIIAESKSEFMLIQQLLHSSDKKELQFSNLLYKKVISSQQGKLKPVTADKKGWFIDAEFIALDPVPYNAETGEVMY